MTLTQKLRCLIVMVSVAWCGWCGRAASAEFVALPENGNTIGVMRHNKTYLEFAFIGWGPNWKYLGFHGSVTEAGA
jgi:hypothetical protein